MKKILLLICCSLCFIPNVRSQMVVTDVGNMAQLVSLVSTAGEQVTMLSSLVNLMEKTTKVRKVISDGVMYGTSIKNLTRTSSNIVQEAKSLLDFLGGAGKKNLTPKMALRYSGAVLTSTENTVRYVERATKILTEGSFDANDSERLSMMRDLEKALQEEEKNIEWVRQDMNKRIRDREMRVFCFESQGFKVR